MPVRPISAISLDFFNTLVYHCHGLGRGVLLKAYFEAQGWSAGPWKHSVLDDLFAVHGAQFAPDAPPSDHSYFETIIASAEVGFEKPDSRVFAHACGRLGLPPEHVLHIGHSLADDVKGARQAGLRALHLRRDLEASTDPATIRSLTDVVPLARSWLSIRT